VCYACCLWLGMFACVHGRKRARKRDCVYFDSCVGMCACVRVRVRVRVYVRVYVCVCACLCVCVCVSLQKWTEIVRHLGFKRTNGIGSILKHNYKDLMARAQVEEQIRASVSDDVCGSSKRAKVVGSTVIARIKGLVYPFDGECGDYVAYENRLCMYICVENMCLYVYTPHTHAYTHTQSKYILDGDCGDYVAYENRSCMYICICMYIYSKHTHTHTHTHCTSLTGIAVITSHLKIGYKCIYMYMYMYIYRLHAHTYTHTRSVPLRQGLR